jgi:hypothetical protein
MGNGGARSVLDGASTVIAHFLELNRWIRSRQARANTCPNARAANDLVVAMTGFPGPAASTTELWFVPSLSDLVGNTARGRLVPALHDGL